MTMRRKSCRRMQLPLRRNCFVVLPATGWRHIRSRSQGETFGPLTSLLRTFPTPKASRTFRRIDAEGSDPQAGLSFPKQSRGSDSRTRIETRVETDCRLIFGHLASNQWPKRPAPRTPCGRQFSRNACLRRPPRERSRGAEPKNVILHVCVSCVSNEDYKRSQPNHVQKAESTQHQRTVACLNEAIAAVSGGGSCGQKCRARSE